MNKKLYVFGDSFATPYICVDPKNSFWGLAATDINVSEIYCYCWPGNCLENIVHILLNEEFDFENGYFIIGIPPLLRNSIYTEIKGVAPDADNRKLHKFNGTFTNQYNLIAPSIQFVGNWEFSETFSNDKLYVSYFKAEWRDVLSLEKIYLLAKWLESKNSNFIIVNLTVPIYYQDSWPAGQEIMKKTNSIKNCVLFDNTFYSVNYTDKIKPADYREFGWVGHHGLEGNHNWYNKVIKPLITELRWIS
jgi:hypothetical protein